MDYINTTGLSEPALVIIGFALYEKAVKFGDSDVPYILVDGTAIHTPFMAEPFHEFTTITQADNHYGAGFFDRWFQLMFTATPENRDTAEALLSERVYLSMENGLGSPSHEDIYALATSIARDRPELGLNIIPHREDCEYSGTIWFR